MNILFVHDGSIVAPIRVGQPSAELERRGHLVGVHSYKEVDGGPVGIFDAIIFQRPVVNLARAFAEAHQSGTRCIVDYDDDLTALPKAHPDYEFYRQAAPEVLSNCRAADVLITSTDELGRRLGRDRKGRCEVIPNGWSAANLLWDRVLPRETVNVGWAGTGTHREDLRLALPGMVRAARENPDIRLVIGGDPWAYRQLDRVPERQKMFIPWTAYEDYPFLLSYFDILLAPLCETPFNLAKSDIKLVEAGARGIPYVASPIQQYRAWDEAGEFGLFARSEGEWRQAIGELAADPERRSAMGAAGRTWARFREMRRLGDLWEAILR